MNLLLYEDYRKVFKECIQQRPKKGRGQIELLAQALNVHQSFISQVLNGARNFSEEQALVACGYFDLTPIESEYVVTLVQIERTANVDLKALWTHRLMKIREQGSSPYSELGRGATELSEADKAIFYSSWIYSAVWLSTSLAACGSVDQISKRLKTSEAAVQQAVDFLLSAGLCKVVDGRLTMLLKRTVVTSSSPMRNRHHMNWRLKSMDMLQNETATSLFYTQPMVISDFDAKQIREILIRAISEIEPLVEPSASEKTFCLNIDWFEF